MSQATALVVKAAADARDAGADAAEVERVARETAASGEMFFVLDTLDYLVKGGRAGRAPGLAASVLDIKPVLRFEDGIIEPFRKTRGTNKAFAELAEHVAEDASDPRPPQGHAAARVRPRAGRTAARGARGRGRRRRDRETSASSAPSIGTYAGPSAVGLAYHPMR